MPEEPSFSDDTAGNRYLYFSDQRTECSARLDHHESHRVPDDQSGLAWYDRPGPLALPSACANVWRISGEERADMDHTKDIRDLTIVLAGTGRLAWHRPDMLALAGLRVAYVLGRSTDGVQNWQQRQDHSVLWIQPICLRQKIFFVILAVSDAAIPEVAGSLKGERRMMIHCSGSAVSEGITDGVCYPLQTFSRERQPVYNNIPFFLTAYRPDTEAILKQLVLMINGKFRFIDDDTRSRLHLAAVVVNNFTNHLVQLASEYLHGAGMSYQDLLPLLEETVYKLEEMDPGSAQTGPAVRRDLEVISKHLQMLQNHPALQDVYELMSRNLQEKYRHH